MNLRISEATNFIRIFKVPNAFPEEFCFNGGHQVEFKLVDWFNPFDMTLLWNGNILQYESTGEEYQNHINTIREFIKNKKYYSGCYTYLAITDYGDSFIINPEVRRDRLEFEVQVLKSSMVSFGYRA